MTERPIFLLVFNTIYIKASFEWKFQNFLRNLIHCNMHLEISGDIFAYYLVLITSSEFIFSDAEFSSFIFFLSLLDFFLSLFFLFENGINPVISFISFIKFLRATYILKLPGNFFSEQGVDQQNTFHSFDPNWPHLNSLKIKFPLKYVRDCF